MLEHILIHNLRNTSEFNDPLANLVRVTHADDLSALSDAELCARIHANLDQIAVNNLAAFDAAVDTLLLSGHACVTAEGQAA